MHQEILEEYESVFVSIGIIVLIVLSYEFLRKIHSIGSLYLISKRDSFNPKNYGKWAVVTGGNSGIGESYAKLLAERGMNILIISRTLDTLKSVAEKIKVQYGVECDYIQADFIDGPSVYEKIQRQLENKDVGMVIISAGIVGNVPCFFLEETDDNVMAMIELHIRAVVFMIRMCLPLMLEKNCGAVVTVSSLSSAIAYPLLSTYSSCKAFSDRLTRAISWEFKDKNIHIQSLVPSFVDTKMIHSLKKNGALKRFFVIPCDSFCSSALQTVGLKNHTTGHWKHEFYNFSFFQSQYWIQYIIFKIFMVPTRKRVQHQLNKTA